MNPKPHLKDLARTLYFQTDHSQYEIAHLIGVHRRTVHLWIKHGDWKKIKAAASQSPDIFVQDIYNQLEELNAHIRNREPGSRFPTTEEADIIRKLTMSIKAVNVRPLGDTVRAFEELTGELYKSEPALGRLVAQYADAIIKRKKQGVHFYYPGEDDDEERGEPQPAPIPVAGSPEVDTPITTHDKENNNRVTTEVTKSNNGITSPAAPPQPSNPPPPKITWDNRFPRYRNWEKSSRKSNNTT